MQGYLERAKDHLVKGWAFEKKNAKPADIRLKVDGKVVLEGKADLERPDVVKVIGQAAANSGFAFNLRLPNDQLDKLIVEATSDGQTWTEIKRHALAIPKPPAPKKPAETGAKPGYQSFDTKGASDSHAKLAALKLQNLWGHRSDDTAPLYGKSVLDLGCNEGFFCGEALRQGASRVVGIDQSQTWIDKAKARFPEAEFRKASWWALKDEKFDVILLLSAIHYEPNQKALLRKLASHLTPNGVLILECGVYGTDHRKQWTSVGRWDGEKRYPSLALLRDDLLSDYGVRFIGGSVTQAGDPVPRYVFHCTLRRPDAIIISGRSHDGKTSLRNAFLGRGIVGYDSDSLLIRLLTAADRANHPLAVDLRKKFAGHKSVSEHLGQVGEYIAKNDLADQFARTVCREVPADAGLFIIEGEIFRHDIVHDALVRELDAIGVRAWSTKRVFPGQPGAPVEAPVETPVQVVPAEAPKNG